VPQNAYQIVQPKSWAKIIVLMYKILQLLEQISAALGSTHWYDYLKAKAKIIIHS